MQQKDTTVTRWYREPYAWLVALLPAAAVVAGFYTLRLAIVSDDGLVTDDYYRKGLEINRVLERDERAASLAISADVEVDPAARTATVRMHARDADTLPASLRARLMHSTRAGFDRDVVLERAAGGAYFAALPELPPGHWYMQIESGDWRVLETFTVGLHGK
ncbi:MAG: FixH family protein [Gammaproteobacteria bacterium]|nr:FixH family protein [Gammaproteobacteria bacterium]